MQARAVSFWFTGLLLASAGSVRADRSTANPPSRPVWVKKVLVTDCRGVRGFVGASVDGSVHSRDSSGCVAEYLSKASNGVQYNFNRNDGVHLALADAQGFDGGSCVAGPGRGGRIAPPTPPIVLRLTPGAFSLSSHRGRHLHRPSQNRASPRLSAAPGRFTFPGADHAPSKSADATVKRRVAFVLQAAVVLIGAAVLAFLLGEPHLEGRNAQATLFEIYFKDPFLAYVYLGSTPFFLALYRAYGLLGQLGMGKGPSQETVTALRAIQRDATVLLCFVAGAVVFILGFGDGEDRPAGVFMGVLAASGAILLALGAAASARKVETIIKQSRGSQG